MLHDVFDQLAVVGKAFGSGRRLEMVDVLAQGERTVESLARACGMRVGSVSAHLQVLRLANLVKTRRDGTRVYYRLAGDDVAALYEALLTVARDRSADVEAALKAHLDVTDEGGPGLVSRDELAELVESGEVEVVDVRPTEEFEAGHITGAVSMPFERIGDGEFTGDRPIVVYCRGAFCVMAHDALRLLAERGIPARRLEDGMLEWRLAGLPVTVPEAAGSGRESTGPAEGPVGSPEHTVPGGLS